MKDSVFEIRSYGYNELAVLYAPELNLTSASRRLRRWIRVNVDLESELKLLGWQKGSRVFTPMQVQTLVDFLGEP